MLKTPPPGNLQIIDLARSVSIGVVLASHFSFFAPEPGARTAMAWDLLRSQGRAAVTVFFLVSGFLITRILDRHPGGLAGASLRWFYARRIGRIVPLFLLQVFTGLLMIVVFGAVLGDHSLDFFRCFKLPRDPLDPWFWAALLTILPFSWAANFLKAAWGDIGLHWSIYWSLAIEEQFYLLYPLLLRLFPQGKKLTAVLALLALVFLAISCGGSWWAPGTLPVFTWSDTWCYGAIALGALLYLVDKQRGQGKAGSGLWRWAAVGLGALFFFSGIIGIFQGLFSILNVPLTDLGVFLGLWGGLGLSFFQSPWLKFAALPGKYSYGLYLLHMTVLYLGRPWLARLAGWAGTWTAFAAYGLLATAVAALSYHAFEVPANRDIRSRWGIAG